MQRGDELVEFTVPIHRSRPRSLAAIFGPSTLCEPGAASSLCERDRNRLVAARPSDLIVADRAAIGDADGSTHIKVDQARDALTNLDDSGCTQSFVIRCTAGVPRSTIADRWTRHHLNSGMSARRPAG
jgi:hypothetical protein